jgi:hypothetical protein
MRPASARPSSYGVRLAAALAGAALALTACGGSEEPAGDSDGPDGRSALGAVSTAVAEQERVHQTIGDGGSEPAVDVLLDVTEPRTMQVLIDTMPGEGPPDDIEVRLVEGVLYVGGEVSDGWQSMPVDDPRAQGSDETFDAGFMPALLAIDPAAEMAALEAAATEVEEVGREEVEAVDSVHYRVTVDTEKWMSGLSPDAMQAEVDLPKTIAVDLWVAPDDLPVRISYPVGTVGEDEAVNQVDYVEWDAPVDVDAPKNARPLR